MGRRLVLTFGLLVTACTTPTRPVYACAAASRAPISLDRDGHGAMPFNSPGRYRGYIGEDGIPHVMLFIE